MARAGRRRPRIREDRSTTRAELIVAVEAVLAYLATAENAIAADNDLDPEERSAIARELAQLFDGADRLMTMLAEPRN